MSESGARKTWGPLAEVFAAGRPLSYVRSADEGRVVELMRAAAGGAFSSPVPLWIWTATEGVRRDGAAEPGEPLGAREALDFVARHEGPGLFLLKDFHSPSATRPRSAAGCATSTSRASTTASSWSCRRRSASYPKTS